MVGDHVCNHGIRNDTSTKLMDDLRKFGKDIHFYPVNKLRTLVCEQANALKEMPRLFNPTI